MAQKQNSLQLNQVLEFEIWPYCSRGNAHQMMDVDYNFETYIFPIFILCCAWTRAIYISKLIYTLEGQKSLYWCHRQSYPCPKDLISEISSNIINIHLAITMIKRYHSFHTVCLILTQSVKGWMEGSLTNDINALMIYLQNLFMPACTLFCLHER